MWPPRQRRGQLGREHAAGRSREGEGGPRGSHVRRVALGRHVGGGQAPWSGDGLRLRLGDTGRNDPLITAGIVDDTGAGNAFAAGFLDSWIRDCDLASALRSGLTTARVKLRHVGLAPVALAAARSVPRT